MSRAAFKLMTDARKGILPPQSFKTRRPPKDDGSLHVYGFCAWSGPIANVGRTKPEGKPIYVKGCSIPIPPVSLPCCPHCGSLLMQIAESVWQAGLTETDRHCPFYADFFRWKEAQPKCWKTMDEAAAEYRQATGNDFKLPIPPKQ